MFRFTHHGFREMLIGTLVLVIVGSVLGWVSGIWLLALLVLPVLVWLFAFFRDPERRVPDEQHLMVSPADGVVSDITEIDHDPLLNAPAVRVGIFLSVFNVHVNRSPCAGKILSVVYKKGKFINAMSHAKASEDNESNTLVIGDLTTGKPVAVVKQIVGLIARRIICDVSKDDEVTRGQRFGMIKFGSRTELTIPMWLKPTVNVQVGQKVRGAIDVIATLDEAVHATKPAVDESEIEPLIGRQTPA